MAFRKKINITANNEENKVLQIEVHSYYCIYLFMSKFKSIFRVFIELSLNWLSFMAQLINKQFDMANEVSAGQLIRLEALINEISSIQVKCNFGQQSKIQYEEKLRTFYTLFSKILIEDSLRMVLSKDKLKTKDKDIQYSYICFVQGQVISDQDNQQVLNQSSTIKRSIIQTGKIQDVSELSIQFDVDGCVQQAVKNFRYRYPQIQDYIELYNFANFDQFLIQRGVKLSYIKYLLKDIVRNMLIDKVYYIEMKSQHQNMPIFKELKQKLSQEIQYLQKVYQKQDEKIRELFPQDIISFVSPLITLQNFPSFRNCYLCKEFPQQNMIKQEVIQQQDIDYNFYDQSEQQKLIKEQDGVKQQL